MNQLTAERKSIGKMREDFTARNRFTNESTKFLKNETVVLIGHLPCKYMGKSYLVSNADFSVFSQIHKHYINESDCLAAPLELPRRKSNGNQYAKATDYNNLFPYEILIPDNTKHTIGIHNSQGVVVIATLISDEFSSKTGYLLYDEPKAVFVDSSEVKIIHSGDIVDLNA